MLKKFTIYFLPVCLLLTLFSLTPALAAVPPTSTPPAAAPTGVPSGISSFGASVFGGSISTPLPVMIGIMIKMLLGLVGLLFFILVLYGGFLYMTSGGEKEKISKGKNYILYAALGLALVLSAYAIASFVTRVIINAQTGYN